MQVSRKVLQTTFAYAITTAVGFLGTVYFARTLGPGVIGTFSLGISIVLWGSVFDFGIGISVLKRISEGNRQSRFLAAGLLSYVVIAAAYCLGLLLARDVVNSYVGADVTILIILLFAGKMAYGGLTYAINGANAVHIKNWIDAAERLARVAVQAILVTLGLSFVGLYAGYVVSIFLGSLCALFYLRVRTDFTIRLPTRLEFQDLFTFAKFSWLSRVKSQTISWMDVFLLGFFVTPSLVGVYQIAWTISKTFGLLPKAISANVFPEVSGLIGDNDDRIQMMLREGILYAGYVAIPGTVGAGLLGRRVMGIYGPEFRSGAVVLVVLSGAVAIQSYNQHLISIIDSIDRPHITFRINSIFIASNAALNVTLIWLYGTIGAAIATLVAAAVSLTLAWYYIIQFFDLRIPFSEVGKQLFASMLMGLVVIGLDRSSLFIGIIELVMLIGTGAMVYLFATAALSKAVRRKSRSLISELPVGNYL